MLKNHDFLSKNYKKNQYESMKKIMIFLTYGNINLFKKTKLKHVQIIKNQCFDIILQVFGKKISTYSITQSPLKSMYKNPKNQKFSQGKNVCTKAPCWIEKHLRSKIFEFLCFFVFLLFFLYHKSYLLAINSCYWERNYVQNNVNIL